MKSSVLGRSFKILLIVLTCCFFNFPLQASQFFSADSNEFLYTGRIDFSSPKTPIISWPGTSIKANFTGSYLAVVLDDERGKNFFSVIIDGEEHFPYVIQAKKGKHTYVISSALAAENHHVEIYKRTEGEEGSSKFIGLEIADKARLLSPPVRPARRIEIYGDSITSGMGNEAANNGEDNLGSEKNNYWAYGAITARNLKAELHTVSRSGIGIMISWFDFIMPQYYDQLSAVGNNDSQWDFSRWTPDVVVINLMQNDSWLIDNEQRLKPHPRDAERITHYQDFVQSIRSKYPDSQLICALGSMDATRTDKWPDYVRKAVDNLKQDGDKKIDYVFFDFNGYEKHPRIAQHQKNAKKLTAFIRAKMNW